WTPSSAASTSAAPRARRAARNPARSGADPRDALLWGRYWGSSSSGFVSSSTLTSLNVTTRTEVMNRAERYTSHTHATLTVSSRYTSPPTERTYRSTWFAREERRTVSTT